MLSTLGVRGAGVDRKEIQGVIRESHSNEGADITADRTQENRSDLVGALQKRLRNDLELTARAEPGTSGSIVFTYSANTGKFWAIPFSRNSGDKISGSQPTRPI